MQFTTTVELEFDVEVEGKFYDGYQGSYWEPPEDPEFDITSLKINGQDATKFLTDEQLEMINEVIFEAATDQVAAMKEQEEEDRAEAKFYERMEEEY